MGPQGDTGPKGPPGGGAPSIVTNGLVMNLDAKNPASYNGTGSTWTDLTGNGNNGTIVNATWNAGGWFDGTGSRYALDEITFTCNNASIGYDPLTFSLWMRANSVNQFIAFYCGDQIHMQYDTWSGNTSLAAGGAYDEIYSGVTVNYGEWFNFVCTYDGTTLKLYKNGQMIASGPKSYNTTTRNGVIGSGDQSFGQVMIYNIVLSDAEVLQNFNATKASYGL
jgi:hypothetical protein